MDVRPFYLTVSSSSAGSRRSNQSVSTWLIDGRSLSCQCYGRRRFTPVRSLVRMKHGTRPSAFNPVARNPGFSFPWRELQASQFRSAKIRLQRAAPTVPNAPMATRQREMATTLRQTAPDRTRIQTEPEYSSPVRRCRVRSVGPRFTQRCRVLDRAFDHGGQRVFSSSLSLTIWVSASPLVCSLTRS